MAYADDAVKAKLSALNETQESIVSVAQWVMFHRRHADRTAQIWLTKLKDSSSNKRLNLVYLANEVAQQSKARKRDEFLFAFQPILSDAITHAYRGATSEIQSKLRRVIEVWRQRQIFETSVQDVLEAKVDELDRTRSSSKRPALGGSLFSSSSSPIPSELQDIAKHQLALSKAHATAVTAVPTAETDYTKLTDPATPLPTPPVHAARLSALLKSLAAAESAVSTSLNARRSLVTGLESLISENKTKLLEEESQHATLTERKDAIEAKKRSVEEGIMRGLSENATGSPGDDPRTNGRMDSATPGLEVEGPDVEALTPPAEEAPPSFDGVPAPGTGNDTADATAAARAGLPSLLPGPPQPKAEYELPGRAEYAPVAPAPQAGADLLSSLNVPGIRQWSGTPESGANKRRKVDDEAGFVGGDAMADLDEDVAELLRQESGGAR